VTQPTRLNSAAEIAGVLAFLLATWVALVIVGLGISSVLFNRDVITDARAGVGLGPAMVFGSLVVFALTLTIAAFRRRNSGRTASPFIAVSLFATALSYLGFIVTGLVGWIVFVPGDPGDALPFAIHTALDWPSAIIAGASLAVAIGFFAYLPWRTRNIP